MDLVLGQITIPLSRSSGTVGGGGDVSSSISSSVDGTPCVFDSTTGKLIRQATATEYFNYGADPGFDFIPYWNTGDTWQKFTLSTDGTLSGDSATAIPTEFAVKTYIDTNSVVPYISGKTLYVRSNGNDGTAIAYREDLAYATIAAAKAAATSGDLIDIGPGTYNERNLLKPGVHLNFRAGAKVAYTGNAAGGIFDDSSTGANAAVTCRITGYGEFTNISTSASNATQVFKLTNTSSIITADFYRAYAENTSGGVAITINAFDGTFNCNAQYIEQLGGSTGAALFWGNGPCHVVAREINVLNGAANASAYGIWSGGSGTAYGQLYVNVQSLDCRQTGTSARPFYINCDTASRHWLYAHQIIGNGTVSNLAVSARTGFIYIFAEKITGGIGTSGGSAANLYVNVQKLACPSGYTDPLINLGGTNKYSNWTIGQIDDANVAAGQSIVSVSNGVHQLNEMDMKRTVTGDGVAVSGGALILKGTNISGIASGFDLNQSGGTLTVLGCSYNSANTSGTITLGDPTLAALGTAAFKNTGTSGAVVPLLNAANTWASGQIFVAPVLGTPASGTLTNCSGLPESGVVNLTSDLALKAPLASPALTGTPTTPTAGGGTNTTQIASTAFVTAAVATAITGTLKFQGSTDCSANPNYPAASKGDTYIVSVAGKIGGASGVAVDVADEYFAIADNAGGSQASVGTSWTVLEHNLNGALLSANNLSDLASASTARTNLGLGTLATQSGTFSGTSSGTNTGDQTTISGNAATATALATARSIYGNNFDGTAALAQIIASTFGGTGNGFTKFSGPTSSEKTKTLRDASDTILELGGSYTPTGTWTWTSATTDRAKSGANSDLTSLALTAASTLTLAPAANTAATGWLITDTTAASSGNQQYSPALRLTGQGWKTTATAASQAVDFRSYVLPVQGTGNPTGYLLFDGSVNGGSFANVGGFDLSGNARILDLQIAFNAANIPVAGSISLDLRSTALYTPSDFIYKWNSTTAAVLGSGSVFSTGSADTGVSRNAAGVVEANSGTAGTLRDFKARTFIPGGTDVTCTGGTIGTGSKNHAGFVTATTTGTSTIVITFTVTAPTGWNVSASDSTAVTNLVQTASTTTTATLSGTTVSGDVIRYIAMPY